MYTLNAKFAILMNFVFNRPIDNMPWLVQEMAWCWIGDKALPAQKVTKIHDAIWGHEASVGL